MGIFLKHLRLIPNILKWQDCKIFTRRVPSRTPSRSSHRRYSVKKDIFKNLNFIKKRPQHRCFWVKFAKLLKTPILKNISERLLLPFLGFTELNRNVFPRLSWRHRSMYKNIINCSEHVPLLLTSKKVILSININLFKHINIYQMFEKIKMIQTMKTSISRNRVSRLY